VDVGRRNGGASHPRRAARPTGTTRCQRVAETVFVLDSAFSRAEHVERVVERGLLDDHRKATANANVAVGVLACTGSAEPNPPERLPVERGCHAQSRMLEIAREVKRRTFRDGEVCAGERCAVAKRHGGGCGQRHRCDLV